VGVPNNFTSKLCPVFSVLEVPESATVKIMALDFSAGG
jgi:hypothetical protein